jgi:ABC-type transport system substrate-binding protein
MDSPALTWEQLKLASRVCRINEQSGQLVSGTVTTGEFDLTILWDDTAEPESFRRYYFNSSQTPIYREGCPSLALAMEWGQQVLMLKALNYRHDLLLNKPEVLPLLQQIRALVGDNEVNELVKRYQSMSAIPKGQRCIDLCIQHLP